MRLRIEYLTPEELQPYANNAKLHPDVQVEQIANSIKEFDFSDPIGIWGANEVVEGHGRLLAALKLGLKEVPVIRLDHLTDEQRRAYMNVHNQTTMTSGWDTEKLLEELGRITLDMTLFGFDDGSVEEEKYSSPENAPEEKPVPQSRVIVAAVSIFGEKTEAFVVKKIDPALAEKLLDLQGGGN